MTVELLDNNTAGVLDLTGGSQSNEPIQDEENKEPLDLTDGEGEANPPQEEEGSKDTDSEGQDDESSSDDSSDKSVDDGADSDTELYFDGKQVNVEVPAEVESALKEAGVESKDLVAQLFKKDGDFSLDEATYQKLSDKFGKVMVDGYLNLYKQQNQATMKSLADQEAADQQQLEQRGTEYADAVGGKEGLESMEAYILDNFNDNQIAAYNAVMESEDHASQLLVISQVKAQMELQDKLVNGDKKVNLLGDNGAQDNKPASPLDKGYLTADEYQNLIESDKYWTDREYMNQVDAARTVGIRKQV